MGTQSSHIGAALAVMTGAGVLLGGAGLAEAVPQAFSLNTSGGPTSEVLTFSQFDPSLGTLTEVDVTLASSSTGGQAFAQITGGEGGRGNFATASLSGDLTLGGPGATTLFSAATSVLASCTIPGPAANSTCSAGPNSQTNPSFAPNPAQLTSGLAAYTGLGTFDLTAAIANLLNADAGDASHSTGLTGTITHTDNLTWSGTVTVSFQFIPAIQAAPEPASLALLSAGIATLGLVRRRQRRR